MAFGGKSDRETSGKLVLAWVAALLIFWGLIGAAVFAWWRS